METQIIDIEEKTDQSLSRITSAWFYILIAGCVAIVISFYLWIWVSWDWAFRIALTAICTMVFATIFRYLCRELLKHHFTNSKTDQLEEFN